MKLSLLNKIAAAGLAAIVIGAVIDIMITIVTNDTTLSAMPITYRVAIAACCWTAIAVVGCIIYFVLKKRLKVQKK